MTAGKRIAVLKNRNDLLISLIKTFLTIGSVEDIYSQVRNIVFFLNILKCFIFMVSILRIQKIGSAKIINENNASF